MTVANRAAEATANTIHLDYTRSPPTGDTPYPAEGGRSLPLSLPRFHSELLRQFALIPRVVVRDHVGIDEPQHVAPEKLPKDLPWRVREVLRRCLEKERKRRLHDVADARLELEDALSSPMSGSEEAVSGATRLRRPMLVAIGVAAARLG